MTSNFLVSVFYSKTNMQFIYFYYVNSNVILLIVDLTVVLLMMSLSPAHLLLSTSEHLRDHARLSIASPPVYMQPTMCWVNLGVIYVIIVPG